MIPSLSKIPKSPKLGTKEFFDDLTAYDNHMKNTAVPEITAISTSMSDTATSRSSGLASLLASRTQFVVPNTISTLPSSITATPELNFECGIAASSVVEGTPVRIIINNYSEFFTYSIGAISGMTYTVSYVDNEIRINFTGITTPSTVNIVVVASFGSLTKSKTFSVVVNPRTVALGQLITLNSSNSAYWKTTGKYTSVAGSFAGFSSATAVVPNTAVTFNTSTSTNAFLAGSSLTTSTNAYPIITDVGTIPINGTTYYGTSSNVSKFNALGSVSTGSSSNVLIQCKTSAGAYISVSLYLVGTNLMATTIASGSTTSYNYILHTNTSGLFTAVYLQPGYFLLLANNKIYKLSIEAATAPVGVELTGFGPILNNVAGLTTTKLITFDGSPYAADSFTATAGINGSGGSGWSASISSPMTYTTLSISFWTYHNVIYTGGIGLGGQFLIIRYSIGNSDTNRYTEIQEYNGLIGVGDYNYNEPVASRYALPQNTWSHVAITLNSSTYTLWVNGVKVRTNQSHSCPTLASGLWLSSVTNPMKIWSPNGSYMDHIRLYNNQSFTDAQVMALYKEFETTFVPDLINPYSIASNGLGEVALFDSNGLHHIKTATPSLTRYSVPNTHYSRNVFWHSSSVIMASYISDASTIGFYKVYSNTFSSRVISTRVYDGTILATSAVAYGSGVLHIRATTAGLYFSEFIADPTIVSSTYTAGAIISMTNYAVYGLIAFRMPNDELHCIMSSRPSASASVATIYNYRMVASGTYVLDDSIEAGSGVNGSTLEYGDGILLSNGPTIFSRYSVFAVSIAGLKILTPLPSVPTVAYLLDGVTSFSMSVDDTAADPSTYEYTPTFTVDQSSRSKSVYTYLPITDLTNGAYIHLSVTNPSAVESLTVQTTK